MERLHLPSYNPVDVLRAAPCRWGILSYMLGASTLANFSDMYAVGIVTVGSAWAAMMVKEQLCFWNRAERQVAVHPDFNHFFALSSRYWCNRQTAKLVALRYGKMDEYNNYFNENKPKIRFSWLPTF